MRRLIKLNGGGNIRKYFNQMFKTARQQGMKYFNFNGKKYSTKMNMGEGKKDTAWEKLNDNAYDLDAGINSFMIPTVDQDKQRTGTTGQISQPEATSAPLRYYNNEFEQASNYANQATNAGESTKTIPGEWQPVLPKADRADFRGDDEYEQGYIDGQYRYNTKTGRYYYDMSGNEPESVYRANGYKYSSLIDRETDANSYKESRENEAQDMKNYYEEQDKENNVRQGDEDGSYAFSYLRAQNEKDGGKLYKKLIAKRN